MHSRLSFVIPALNEAAYIGDAIASIRAAMDDGHGQQDFDVIVADDDSSDSTAEIARTHGAKVVTIRKRNIAAVRNAGAREAEGELLIFVDADTRVSTPLLRETLDAIAHGAVWGTACAVPSDRCPLWARLALSGYNCFHVHLRKHAYGSFFFVKKEAFEAAGGFPEQFPAGEDAALSKLLLERHGAPAVLRARVATSARKAYQFGFWHHLKLLWLTVRYGDEVYLRSEVSEYRDGDLRV